ncbi:hypothetical protein KFL_000440420 [Klebsormidium nitens]|uniref:Uncharacterized protein n=1 Tax=Klebsormidium nitens TaxID=105231 RepID=A0A1Y1HSR9_KLENI|nr:hypothetical protein KFL_000440420 [Klebsormidium nitens]|eukprot:GAQ80041.1 hypothetical protein KFL_000440420 [Klebsormidium nitens]
MAMMFRTARSAFRQARPLVSAVTSTPSRGYAQAAPAQEGDDPVKQIFLDETKKVKTVLEELKKVKIPLNPDDRPAMEAFTLQLREIKHKAGIPTFIEKVDDLLSSAFEDADTLREYLLETKKIRTIVGIDQDEDIDAILLGTLDQVEKQLGRTLKTSDEQGLSVYDSELDKKFAEHDLEMIDEEHLEDTVDYEETVDTVEAMREAAYEAVKQAKSREGLEDVQVTDEELGKAPPGV